LHRGSSVPYIRLRRAYLGLGSSTCAAREWRKRGSSRSGHPAISVDQLVMVLFTKHAREVAKARPSDKSASSVDRKTQGVLVRGPSVGAIWISGVLVHTDYSRRLYQLTALTPILFMYRPRTNSRVCARNEPLAATHKKVRCWKARHATEMQNRASHRVAKRATSKSSSLTSLRAVSSESRRARAIW
jgi:hypothetical protein